MNKIRFAAVWSLPVLLVCAFEAVGSTPVVAPVVPPVTVDGTLGVHYLEIVTPDMDATCEALEKVHEVEFGEPQPAWGNARTAKLRGGGQLGVRAPMRADEEPVVRPYLLVKDIEAAVAAVAEAGAEVAMGATEMPGAGKFAIYIHGGIQHGLWQPLEDE